MTVMKEEESNDFEKKKSTKQFVSLQSYHMQEWVDIEESLRDGGISSSSSVLSAIKNDMPLT